MTAPEEQKLREQHIGSDKYSNRGWCKKFFENVFFEPVWRRKLFDKFSSKSELSSRFFGRLKFSTQFEYLSLLGSKGT